MKNILVIGGAGYIGSHVVKMLKENPNFNPIIYDNLSKGHYEVADILNVKLIKGDLGDREHLKKVFNEEKIDAVMHFAAFIEVGESVLEPGKYYENNVGKVINLLNQMVESNIKYFVFSSTAATFGEPEKEKINELHPQNPINPYGMSKLMVEYILKDFDRAYDFKSVILRYFNAAGADLDGILGESHNPESHLMPLVLSAAKGTRENIKIFGTDYETNDGTCIRDYIHVYDLALAHILSMEKMMKENKSLDYNLGNGTGYSVREIIDTVKRISNVDFSVVEVDRRAGDPAILIADPTKIFSETDYKASYTLEDIVKSAWKWEQNKKY